MKILICIFGLCRPFWEQDKDQKCQRDILRITKHDNFFYHRQFYNKTNNVEGTRSYNFGTQKQCGIFFRTLQLYIRKQISPGTLVRFFCTLKKIIFQL